MLCVSRCYGRAGDRVLRRDKSLEARRRRCATDTAASAPTTAGLKPPHPS